ncbi:MAG TPA: helix-turn-helix transcriptional regulator [Mycobacteriales bacterium]|nr:helix-turn-helix transcriptional regulator [Mycobacteriales bacterium]
MSRELADFLRSRRDRLQPEQAGIPAGSRRRAPGLRRAEVAQLAGISPDYYMRLEQGRDSNPSVSVLDSLARALQLSDVERDHLHALAHSNVPRPRHRVASVAPEMRRLLDRLDPTPAYVTNAGSDLLAWNSMGAAIFGNLFRDGTPRYRNLLAYTVLDPAGRDLFGDWETVLRRSIASLRKAIGDNPGDSRLSDLAADLSAKSPEFAHWWAQHDVAVCERGQKEFLHPAVGRMVLDYYVLALPDGIDQKLITYTAPAGSPAQDALDLLAMISERDPARR